MEVYAIKFTVEIYTKKQVFQIYYVVGDGLFFGIEVKDPQGKPSAMQLAQGARIKKAHGHFIIAKSLQDVKDYLEKEGLIGLWEN